MLISDDSSQQAKVLTLAQEAANTLTVGEIHVDSKFTPKKVIPIVTTSLEKSLPSLTTVFQDPRDIVDPEKEKDFLDKLHAIEESDSEGMQPDRPVLGKVSLIRRAKCAVTQAMFEETVENHPVLNVKLDESNVKLPEPITEDEDIPTIEEVKRHMNMFHLRRGIPPVSSRIKESTTGKYSGGRRPKTARNNK